MRAFLIITICCLLQLTTFCGAAQPTSARSSIGVDFMINDYQFIPDVIDWSPSRKQLPGIGIHYLHQISSKYQFACMVAGSFTDSVVLKKSLTSKKLLFESDILMQRMFSQPTKMVQPVLGTGVGLQMTKSFSSAYIPLSAGVQVNIIKDIMLSATGQYRYSVTGPMRSHAMYGIGISGWLPRKKQKITVQSTDLMQTSPAQPVVDRDHDGINDTDDQCPDLAGIQDNDGCPAKKSVVKENFTFDDSTAHVLNTLAKKILFATNTAEIKNESFIVLKKIYIIIDRYSGLQLLIEGHTDNVGNDLDNLKLSKRRANAVMDYLIKKGIDAHRLQAAGFGESRPVTSNENEEGRAQNRRVVFSKSN